MDATVEPTATATYRHARDQLLALRGQQRTAVESFPVRTPVPWRNTTIKPQALREDRIL